MLFYRPMFHTVVCSEDCAAGFERVVGRPIAVGKLTSYNPGTVTSAP